MKRKTKLPELLAPAGDFLSLVAAVNAGADAIYIGGKQYGARAFAKNFERDELIRAVRYCHIHGVKLYVTMNTLLSDGEIEEAANFADFLYENGIDAIIITDVGLIKEIRDRGNPIELHASTQMSVHNSLGADFVAKLGCSRAVLARELSFSDIVKTTELSSVETEVFLHGALCVCYSGQCLFSSLVGGRSGNRGECAQPCRLPYGKGYPLSLADLCLAGHVKELISSGAASLKIEGRMKSPDYVKTVTSVYRRLLDEGRNATADETELLRRAFSRGGFTDAYFRATPSQKMTGIRSEEDKQASRTIKEELPVIKRREVMAKFYAKIGEPASLTLAFKDGERSVTVRGDEPNPAISSPLTEAELSARLCKMGNSFLSLRGDDISFDIDGNINMSPSSINALRRAACDAIESTEREKYNEVKKEEKPKLSEGVRGLKSALFFEHGTYEELLKDGDILSYFDVIFLPLSYISEPSAICAGANGVYIPPIISESELSSVKDMLKKAKEKGIAYALISNLSHYSLAKEHGFIPVGDFRLNITNKGALEKNKQEGLYATVLSAELDTPVISDLGEGAIVYGRIPLMLTERCFIKENFGCDKCSNCSLSDRKGKSFPLIREYKHRNLVLNSLPTYMGDCRGELRSRVRGVWHFLFTTEKPAQIKSIISAFKKGERPREIKDFRRLGRR